MRCHAIVPFFRSREAFTRSMDSRIDSQILFGIRNVVAMDGISLSVHDEVHWHNSSSIRV